MNRISTLPFVSLVVTLVFALGVAPGCSKKRVAECDEFAKTAEKLGKCEKIPAAQRETIGAAAKQIKEMLQMVDDAGGFDNAPKELVDEMRQTCKSQHDTIVNQLKADFGDCL